MTPLTVTFSISNLQEEKKKFFEDTLYQPQFQYENDIDHQSLQKYGEPTQRLTAFSLDLLQKSLASYESYGRMLELEGSLLDQVTTQTIINNYLEESSLTNKVEVKYLSQLIPRTAVNVSGDKCVLKIRVPVSYGDKIIKSVLDHEIGTHVMRWVNEFDQIWRDDRAKYQLKDHVETEEGLAVWHTMLTHPVKYLWQPAVYYYAVSLAQQMSFADLFTKLEEFVESPEYRWALCVRVKRGLQDTSQPGGFTKDILYLQGAVKIAQWLSKHDFNSSPLYIGKIAVEDLDRCLPLSKLHYLVPHWVETSQYKEKLLNSFIENGVLDI